MPELYGHTPSETEMETMTGRYVDLSDPQPDTIEWEDIAWHLSLTQRFSGATRRPYSVAEHVLLVVDRLVAWDASPAVCLAGLHHDDAEAYLNDMIRPQKVLMPDYRVLEDRMADAIRQAFNLPTLSSKEIAQLKAADTWACAAEAQYLMRSKGKFWPISDIFHPEDDEFSRTIGDRLWGFDGLDHRAIANALFPQNYEWQRKHRDPVDREACG